MVSELWDDSLWDLLRLLRQGTDAQSPPYSWVAVKELKLSYHNGYI